MKIQQYSKIELLGEHLKSLSYTIFVIAKTKL